MIFYVAARGAVAHRKQECGSLKKARDVERVSIPGERFKAEGFWTKRHGPRPVCWLCG